MSAGARYYDHNGCSIIRLGDGYEESERKVDGYDPFGYFHAQPLWLRRIILLLLVHLSCLTIIVSYYN